MTKAPVSPVTWFLGSPAGSAASARTDERTNGRTRPEPARRPVYNDSIPTSIPPHCGDSEPKFTTPFLAVGHLAAKGSSAASATNLPASAINLASQSINIREKIGRMTTVGPCTDQPVPCDSPVPSVRPANGSRTGSPAFVPSVRK